MSTYQDVYPIVKNNELYGYGIDHDEMAIKNSLLNLFTIQKGDVPGKPYLGNPLDIALFDLFDFFKQSDMETAIVNMITKYEPRVQLHSVVVTEAAEYNRIIIQINYSFIVDNGINYDSLEVPYSHNTVSFLGGRIKPPDLKATPPSCTATNISTTIIP